MRGHPPDCKCCSCRSKRGDSPARGSTHTRNWKPGHDAVEKVRTENPSLYHQRAVERGKASVKSRYEGPNNPECQIMGYIYLYDLPYHYSGQCAFWIGDCNPDFTHNIEQIVIEYLGDHWHSKKIKKRTKQQEEQYLINNYAKHGYKCIILWESEFKNISEQELLNKLIDTPIPLKEFVNLTDFY